MFGFWLINPSIDTFTSISDTVSPSNSGKTPEGSLMGLAVRLFMGLNSSGKILKGEIPSRVVFTR